jgi:hypothetical protein
MRIRDLILLLVTVGVTACAANTVVQTGVNPVGKMRVSTAAPWTSVGQTATPATNGVSRTWTRNGLPQDRLLLISGVDDGEPIFKSGGTAFRADMSPAEITELVQASTGTVIGNPAAAFSAASPREQNFGQNNGVMFELSAAAGGDDSYRGTAGAFVFEDELYILLFLAADAQTYTDLRDEAEAVMLSAMTRVKTIGRY